ncbi:MAG: ribonuclease H-like domain-containing protein [Monoraphidium minutum]|nr:MAG: ribonuclease H-like domain-containing protein [Monoraphidium minutum]
MRPTTVASRSAGSFKPIGSTPRPVGAGGAQRARGPAVRAAAAPAAAARASAVRAAAAAGPVSAAAAGRRRMAAPANFYAALMNLRVSDDGSGSAGGSPTAGKPGGGARKASVSTRAAANAPAAAEAAAADTTQAAAAPAGAQPSAAADSSGTAAAAAAAAEGAASASGGGDAAAADAAAKEAAAKEAAAKEAAAKRKRLPSPLVWIDLEMTGLDLDKDTIIEIACLVTDGDLKTVVEGPSLVIHHPEEVLDNMNDWCKEHHGKSGLTQRVRDSTVTLEEAEKQVLEFVAAHTEYQAAQLAGNSVHVDRAFMQRRMPALLAHMHYRIVDVSSISEVARRWSPKLARNAPRKKGAHTALSDIKESLEELRYYRDKLFRGVK